MDNDRLTRRWMVIMLNAQLGILTRPDANSRDLEVTNWENLVRSIYDNAAEWMADVIRLDGEEGSE